MTKADIVTEISKKTGIDKATVLTTVEAFMEGVKSPLAECSEETKNIYSHLEELTKSKYPHFSKDDISYYQFNPDGNDLMLINYTSGSTGKSKGVMIPNRSIWSKRISKQMEL